MRFKNILLFLQAFAMNTRFFMEDQMILKKENGIKNLRSYSMML